MTENEVSPLPGFLFRRLRATGKGLTPAELEFRPGLNVVAGASNTGKSYVVSCLDFMTGATRSPLEFDESRGYETLWLEISDWAGNKFTLERSLRGGDFRLYPGHVATNSSPPESQILRAKKQRGGTPSASSFLLDLCRLSGTILKKNRHGVTREISFRDMAHLTIIQEDRIYTHGSPIHGTGEVINKTVEQSLFQFLLTGVDDSSAITAVVETEKESATDARMETIDEIIKAIARELESLTDSPQEIEEQLARLGVEVDRLTTSLTSDRFRVRAIETEREAAWGRLRAARSRRTALDLTVSRFVLLQEHYRSDIERLGAIAEAGRYFGDLPVLACPVCGATEHSDDFGREEFPNAAALVAACVAEMRKVTALAEDLYATVEQLIRELRELEQQIEADRRIADALATQLDDELRPSEVLRREELQELLAVRSRLERAAAIAWQIELLQARRAELEGEVADVETPGRPAAVTRTSQTEGFCRVVEKVLQGWNFPGADRVTFSESTQDLVIGGKERGSNGKGIRALTYAAFIIGLMHFCRRSDRPHPGFVVLDSPLVAYREPDEVAQVSTRDIKGAFYRWLATFPKGVQVIVFENEEPPDDITGSIGYTHFGGPGVTIGRAGFFPVRG